MCQIQCVVDPADEDRTNFRPTVAITEGALDSASVDYRVDFRWRGRDEDGGISGFEWAIDDTILENAWQWTTELGGRFMFRATTEPDEPPDSLFHDWHRFFVRAVDDESAKSEIDSRYFNATTIGPQTTIVAPPIRGDVVRVPNRLDVVWEGEDLDASKPEKIPEFYEYKMAVIHFGDIPEETLLEGENVLLDTLDVPDPTMWIRVPSDVTSVRVDDLGVNELYVFGVRAIDEAGAVEPRLRYGRNMFVLETTDYSECRPSVTIDGQGLGSHTFPDDGPVWTLEAPSDTPIHFTWIGDAEFCGRRPGRVRYCLDGSDCVGWDDLSELVEPFVFPGRDDGKTHEFILWMRDDTDDPRSARECRVEIKVILLTMDKTVLVVDDATPPRGIGGTDAEHDAFRDGVLSCLTEYLGPDEEIDYFNIYGDQERSANAKNIELSLIGRYRLVIWNSYFFGRIESGLTRNEFRRGVLSHYLFGGGRVYLFGSKPIGSLAHDNYGDFLGDGLCPEALGGDRPAWDETSFIWSFLRLRSCVRGPEEVNVDGWVGARGVHPVYPDLAINPDVWDPWGTDEHGDLRGGTKSCQIYKAPEGQPPEPDPHLDTIYVARTFNLGGRSELDGQPCALRYEPPGMEGRRRVFLQMFDFLFVDEEAAREAACKAVGWLMTGRDE
jgi:hypothetical protein